jgi:hypothetical protein
MPLVARMIKGPPMRRLQRWVLQPQHYSNQTFRLSECSGPKNLMWFRYIISIWTHFRSKRQATRILRKLCMRIMIFWKITRRTRCHHFRLLDHQKMMSQIIRIFQIYLAKGVVLGWISSIKIVKCHRQYFWIKILT